MPLFIYGEGYYLYEHVYVRMASTYFVFHNSFFEGFFSFKMNYTSRCENE